MHKSDYVRAFLLHHFGGLWLDSDTVVLRDLEPIIDQIQEYDFAAPRDVDRIFWPNPTLFAKRDSVVAAAFYGYVRDKLRAGGPIRWAAIGRVPLSGILRHAAGWFELPKEWVALDFLEPDLFFARGTPAEHQAKCGEKALLYVLSANMLAAYQAACPGADLMAPDSFFTWLLQRSEANSE